jgi:8-hydroxy-5-deazaflavin:NADPH oxidoreductase
MRVGVIGSGGVGQTLAEGLKKHGYEARIASRTPGKLADFSRESGIEAGTFADVAAWAEAIVFAVAGSAAQDAIAEVGPENLEGKTVIDTTNPIAKDARPEDGVLTFFTPANASLMEQLQAAVPGAKFVKAFNSVGSDLMVNPSFPGGAKPTMFYCGNDAGAKALVATIIDQFGWEGADMGSARAAGPIEALCLLWCIPGFLHNEWDRHAFHLLKR